MRVLFHIFCLGEAQTSVALSTQSTRKAPKNPAKQVFLVLKYHNNTNIVRSTILKIKTGGASSNELTNDSVTK